MIIMTVTTLITEHISPLVLQAQVQLDTNVFLCFIETRFKLLSNIIIQLPQIELIPWHHGANIDNIIINHITTGTQKYFTLTS